MDSTVEQVVQSIDRLNTQMGALLGGQDDVTLGDQRIAQAVNRLQESQDRDNKDSRRSIGEAVRAAPQEMMKNLKSDSVIEGFMRSMGLGMLATQFGMVQGAAATLGATFQFAGSVGLSYAGDIEKTQKRLAAVGLQLDDFGNAVAQNLGVMRTLGDLSLIHI